MSDGARRLGRPARAPVVLVSSVGAARGVGAAAAALACALSEPDRAVLVVEMSGGRPPRQTLIATAGARSLEERLVAHLPEATIASRGAICVLRLAADEGGLERLQAALPLARDSGAVVQLAPRLLQPALDEPRIGAGAVLLVADLATDRPLLALAVRDLLDRGIAVGVVKRPLSWVSARRALHGALPPGGGPLPRRLVERLLRHRSDPR